MPTKKPQQTGRTLWDILFGLGPHRLLMGLGVLFVLAILATILSYFGTEPGKMVNVLGYGLFRRPLGLEPKPPDERKGEAARAGMATGVALPNLLVSSCADYDHYANDQTKSCAEPGAFSAVADGPFRVHGSYVEGASNWTALLLTPRDCELCRAPNSIRFLAETHSTTPCLFDVSIDSNHVKTFNQVIYSTTLNARQTVVIPIGDEIQRGYRSFLLVPSPAGCDLVLVSLMLE